LVAEAALFGLLAVADALVPGDVLLVLERFEAPDAGVVAMVPTISTRCPT
jgi:hypothetical protein